MAAMAAKPSVNRTTFRFITDSSKTWAKIRRVTSCPKCAIDEQGKAVIVTLR
jgi:hypothetical protein